MKEINRKKTEKTAEKVKEKNQTFDSFDNEDLLKLLLENTKDTIYFKDVKGRFRMINNAQMKVLSLNSKEEAIGKTDFDFFNEEHAKESQIDEQNIIKTAEPLLAKTEYLRQPNGKYRWFSASKVPIKNDDGEIIGLLGISRDITDRKNSVELLRNSEEIFSLIWEKSIDGFRIMDENGIVELVNDSFCKMVNKKREELVGKPFTEIYGTELVEEMRRKQRERLKNRTIEDHFERELVLWNGERVNYELSNSILELTGKKPKIFSIFHDITKRVEAEDNLKKINDELEDRINKRTNELALVNARLKEELVQKAKVEQELKMNLRELEMNKILLEQDENELKNMNERLIESEIKLRKLNANKYIFLSLISDELREPLNKIIERYDSIMTEIDSNSREKIKESLSDLFGSVKSMDTFLENIFYWLKIQTGKVDYKPQLIDLHRAIDTSLNKIKSLASEKEISLVNEITEDVLVYADKELLETIIHHLIGNAIKFSHHNSNINIFSRSKNEFEEIVIKDNGIGMSKETLAKLFRIDVKPTLKEDDTEKGSAMGLILCKELVDKHGGNIKVESELGKGTKVIFTLRRLSNL